MPARASLKPAARFVRAFVLTLVAGTLATACNREITRGPTAPAGAAPAPAPVPAPVPIPVPAGSLWTGTFASANWPFSPFGISVRLVVDGNTVTGTWSDLPWWDFAGSIAGTLDGTAFTGTLAINHCKAEVQGTLTATTGTWTSPGVTEECAPLFPGLAHPVDITLQLSR